MCLRHLEELFIRLPTNPFITEDRGSRAREKLVQHGGVCTSHDLDGSPPARRDKCQHPPVSTNVRDRHHRGILHHPITGRRVERKRPLYYDHAEYIEQDVVVREPEAVDSDVMAAAI